MLEVFLLAVVIIGIAFLGLGVKTFLFKAGKFPETRIGHNKEMRKRKIFCPKTMHKIEQKGCTSCSTYYQEL